MQMQNACNGENKRSLRRSNPRVVAASLLIGLLFLKFGMLGLARPALALGFTPTMPKDVGRVEIYLWTFGRGKKVEEKWGHNALRVVDPEAHTDLIYNMGTYDQFQPGFMFNFVKGVLIYKLSISTYRATLRRYQHIQRSVLQEKLNLTTGQKERLLARLIWQAQPENVNYPYQYWFNNCSTKLRDFIDEAVGGQIHQLTHDIDTDKTFRHYVRHNLEKMPLLASLLDMAMNSDIDRTITVWEEMFLPDKLREHLLHMPAFNNEGVAVSGRHLLSDSKELFSFPQSFWTFWYRWYRGYQFGVLLVGLLGILGLSLIAKSRLQKGAIHFALGSLGVRLIGMTFLISGLFSTLFSTLSIMAWICSLHTDLHHNANLWLFWPLDLLYIVYGVALAYRGKWPGPTKASFMVAWLSFAHLLAALIWGSGYYLGGFNQDIRFTLLYLGPFMVSFYVLVLYQLKNTLLPFGRN